LYYTKVTFGLRKTVPAYPIIFLHFLWDDAKEVFSGFKVIHETLMWIGKALRITLPFWSW